MKLEWVEARLSKRVAVMGVAEMDLERVEFLDGKLIHLRKQRRFPPCSLKESPVSK
jgi:hypothetical protein